MRSKRERTRERLWACAMELFERDGYDATTVAAIAAAAGVSEMTFFRHFATKERVLLDDPFDPVMVAAVGDQPTDWPPLARVVTGMRTAWRSIPEEHVGPVRARMRIAAGTPSLKAAIWGNNARTEALIAERLIEDGVDRPQARMAAAIVLTAIVVSLLDWAEESDDAQVSIDDAVHRALDLLDPTPRPRST